MKHGYFTFVLHTHLPYVRRAGSWPHGEEMIHEAIAETYIPLLDALNDLLADGFRPRLTLGLTPILLEQLADPDVLHHFERYLDERIALAHSDAERLAGTEPWRANQARRYHAAYSGIREHYEVRYARDLVGAFRRLQDDGHLDVLTSAATHGYLPLLSRDSSIYAQLKTGLMTTLRHMGCSARGVWLPECAYRPACLDADGRTLRPGIETFLAKLGLRFCFVETHLIRPGGPDDGRPTMYPYSIGTTDVAAFARDARISQQVWSPVHGYPGAPPYREFHRRDPVSGLRYWRVTSLEISADQKALYEPESAVEQAHAHAEQFVQALEQRFAERDTAGDRPGLVVAAFDTELFGHWWFEGIIWFGEVLRRLERSEIVELTTASTYLEQFPPQRSLDLPEGSWGAGGGHWAWRNPDTKWIWPHVGEAERRLERLVALNPDPDPIRRQLIEQSARELLLMQSSDWPFLISTGQAPDYASSRFERHRARFGQLLRAAQGEPSEDDLRFLRLTQELDNPFADIDYRWFADGAKRGNQW